VQIVIGVVTLIVGWNLMPLWGPMVGPSPLVWYIALLVMTAAAAFMSGKIPSTRRQLQNIAIDSASAVSVSATGTYNNRKLTLPPPHRVTGGVLIYQPTEPAAPRGDAAQPAPTTAPAPAGRVAPSTPPRYLTGIDRLLAQTGGKDS